MSEFLLPRSLIESTIGDWSHHLGTSGRSASLRAVHSWVSAHSRYFSADAHQEPSARISRPQG